MNSVSLIISISVIILLLYVIFSLVWRDTYTGSIAEANKTVTVTVKDSGPQAAYSIWIYITEWTTGTKNIFSRGDVSSGIKVDLDANINYLVVSVPDILNTSYTKYPSSYISNSGGTSYYGTNETCELLCTKNGDGCVGFNYYDTFPSSKAPASESLPGKKGGCELISKNNGRTGATSNSYAEEKGGSTSYVVKTYIPVQEWVFITINMDSEYTEVYINGKMVRTIINKNKLITGNVILSLGDGFNGVNSKFEASDKTLRAQEIWNKYKAGFGYYSSMSDYSVKIGFYKDDV